VTVSFTVENFVHCQGSTLTKSFITGPTFVWFVFAMDVLVVSQMILSSECLSTHITGEGPLISMCPLMDHHIITFCEFSVTVLADEPLLWSCGSALIVHVESMIITWW